MSDPDDIISPPYQEMLNELREVHGDEIDVHIKQILESSIHESYQELQSEQRGG
jgi:hypothetical protein